MGGKVWNRLVGPSVKGRDSGWNGCVVQCSFVIVFDFNRCKFDVYQGMPQLVIKK
jgi:hypothetical protein